MGLWVTMFLYVSYKYTLKIINILKLTKWLSIYTANLALEIYQKGLDCCVVHTTFLESQNELFKKKDRKIMKILNYVN